MKYLLILLLAIPVAAAPLQIPIVESEGAATSGGGGRTLNWPVTTGIPLPQGAVADKFHATLTDDRGKSVPCDAKPVAWWRHPTASVQWITLRYVSQPGRQYTLQLDGGAEMPPPMKADTPQLDVWFVDGQQHRRDGKLTTTAIEEQSSVHVVHRMVFEHVDDAGKPLARTTLRVSRFAGVPYWKISHAFLILADTEHLQFSDIALRIAAKPDKTLAELDGQLVRGPTLFTAGQEVYRHYGQDTCRAFAGDKQGKAAGNFMDNGNTTVAVKWLAQQFPKSLETTADGMIAHLWSSHGGVLDFRQKAVEAFWGENLLAFWKERNARDYQFLAMYAGKGYDNAQGMEKSHEIWVWPHDAKTGEAQIVEFARLVDEPVLAIASPKWNCDSGALGEISPRDPAGHPDIETTLDQMLAQRLASPDLFGDYGWWAFGGNDHAEYWVKDGKLLANAYRFHESTYRRLRSLWRLYLRSGDRRIYQDLIQRHYHLLDIRVKHINAPPRTLDAPEGANWKAGQILYNYSPMSWWSHEANFDNTLNFSLKEMTWAYAATGDARWTDWFEVWRAHVTARAAQPDWAKKYVHGWGAGYTSSASRLVFTYLDSLIALYAWSGDPAMKQATVDLATAVVDVKQSDGLTPFANERTVGGKGYYLLETLRDVATHAGMETCLESARRLCAYSYLQEVSREPVHPHMTEMTQGYVLTGRGDMLAEALVQYGLHRKERDAQLATPLSKLPEGQARTLSLPSEDKYAWDSLPRLAWALDDYRARHASGGGAPPPHRLLPAVSNLIALEKDAGGAVTAQVCSTGKVRCEGASVRVAATVTAETNTDPIVIYDIEAASAGGAGILKVESDQPMQLISTTAPRYGAFVSGGFNVNSAVLTAPMLVRAPGAKLEIRARFPDKVQLVDLKGTAMPRAADGQKITWSGLTAGTSYGLTFGEDTYMELTGLPVTQRWIALGTGNQLLVAADLAAGTPQPFAPPDVTQTYIDGALQLGPGRSLLVPISADGKSLFGSETGTVEFRFKPLVDLRWHPHASYEAMLIRAGKFDLRYQMQNNIGSRFTSMYMGQSSQGWNEHRVMLEAGRWYTIAVSWKPWEPARGRLLMMIYVDGQPVARVQAPEVGKQGHRPGVMLADHLKIGAMPALWDDLRISGEARYLGLESINNSDYRALPYEVQPLKADDKTLLYMAFEGTLDIISPLATGLRGKLE